MPSGALKSGFQSTLSMRRATAASGFTRRDTIFQSTLSMRRATKTSTASGSRSSFQSTLSMRRATGSYVITVPFRHISIHALHEESDRQVAYQPILQVISIHALHEESDFRLDRATGVLFISIHALHEESDRGCDRPRSRRIPISIHALHEESDVALKYFMPIRISFQSTLSMRRATVWSRPDARRWTFQSTLSMRRATSTRHVSHCRRHFNPRSP